MQDRFDYIIVGAGSAGCVLANRLSADPSRRVLLLEAGGEDDRMLVNMPGGIFMIIPPERKSPLKWDRWTVPQESLGGRPMYWPSGRVLGGSSSINGMVYARGHPGDYDQWAQSGLLDWSWDKVLPYFKRAEDSERGACDLHGTGGPLHVSTRRNPNELNEVFLRAAHQAGIPLVDDFNGPQAEGAGWYDTTTSNGSRWSAARAYLAPVRHRPNLDVRTNTSVERILFEGKQAVGVSYRRGGQLESARASVVISSSGAVGSPRLLMISGIGPASHLRELGIDVVHDSPEVGGNLQDHLDVIPQWTCRKPVTMNGQARMINQLTSLASWLLSKDGAISHAPTPVGAFLSSREGLASPDIQIHFMPVMAEPHGRGRFLPVHGFQMHVCQLNPGSRGTVRLASSSPDAPPLIDPAYLSDPSDVEVLVKGVEIARSIVGAPAFDPYRQTEMWPGEALRTKDDLVAAIRAWGESDYHPVGTCRMGADPSAPLDPTCRVRGVEGLYVVDASVMPTITSGNTNAPTIMIAEKVSDYIRGQRAVANA